MSRRARVGLVLATALLALLLAGPAGAAGPWNARIVETGTGTPLEGVVVVAVYWKMTPGPVHPAQEFHAADEALSDAEGRVTIPARATTPPHPLARIKGPEFTFFRAGYGNWNFQGFEQVRDQDLTAREAFSRRVWGQFAGPGVIIEMPPLRAREERLRHADHVAPSLLVPKNAVPLLIRAIEREHRELRSR